MLTVSDFKDIISQVTYKDWEFVIGGTDDRPYLQIQFMAPDNSDKGNFGIVRKDSEGVSYGWPMERQYCRKWQLSRYMCKSEVIRTAWKAVLAAEEHEAGENFKYMGRDIFNPHMNLENLAFYHDAVGYEVREPQQTG